MKNVLQSKTFWLNLLVAAGMVLTATDVLVIVPKEYLGYVGAANSVVNIVLRVYFTGEAINHG